MKILIASDSHGLTGSLYRIIDTEHPDMLIHLGDMEDDPGRLAAKSQFSEHSVRFYPWQLRFPSV